MVNTSDSWVKIGRWSDDPDKPGPWYFVCSDEKRFRKGDTGGAIYQFSSEGFTTDPNMGTGLAEWVSTSSVVPTMKTIYESGLEAMIANGVRVIFIDKEAMERIEQSDDHGWGIISKLKPVNYH